MKCLFLFITLLQLVVCHIKADNQNNGKISKEQAIEDVDSLVYRLCEIHPNVFSVVTPTNFLMQVHAIKQSTITTRGTLFGIPEGVKIISINGISSKEIIQNTMKYVSGERTFFKLTCVIRVC